MKYKVGDKVKVRSDLKDPGPYYTEGRAIGAIFVSGMRKYCGKVVTIQSIHSSGKYRIQEDGGAWNWTDGMLEGLATTSKIIITSDGKTTTAKLFDGKDLIKSAEAKCSSYDTFDFEKGAALAVDRLLGRDEKVKPEPNKPLNCKVVCISNTVPGKLPCSGFVVGKVYEVRAGHITNDKGWHSVFSYNTIQALSKGVGNQFIKFVE